MIKQWMLEGELLDPHGEFFVSANMAVRDERLWSDRYFLNHQMVPSFFDVVMATKILVTGKSLNFIRRCCNEDDWALSLDMTGNIGEWVETAYKTTNAKVLELLFDKYSFLGHCNAIRKYLLLGQGDFHHSLMEILSDELGKKATETYRHNLVTMVEMAVRSSNVQ
jgi:gamma-tubulin complex component 3